jgi:hypothetical protein
MGKWSRDLLVCSTAPHSLSFPYYPVVLPIQWPWIMGTRTVWLDTSWHCSLTLPPLQNIFRILQNFPEDRGNMFLRNHIPDHTMSCLRRTTMRIIQTYCLDKSSVFFASHSCREHTNRGPAGRGMTGAPAARGAADWSTAKWFTSRHVDMFTQGTHCGFC